MNTPGLPATEPGPRILDTDQGEALLPDSQLGLQWWAPAPEMVEPAEGTFRFQFRVAGHDEGGSPTITAKVTATLRFPPPPPEAPEARPVVRTGVAVRLRIPFVDAVTGALTATELPAEATERDGVVQCEIEVSGALARAAYGALSTPGFQTNDMASLIVDSTFIAVQETEFAWVAAPEAKSMVRNTDLIMRVPIRPRRPFAEPPREESPVLGKRLQWSEVRSRVRVPAVAEVIGRGRLLDVAAFQPLQRVGGSALGVRGRDPNRLPQSPQPTIDMAVALSRQHRVPLLVPCRHHPGLYRQDSGTGAEPEPIGCQDAYQLGRAPAGRFVPAPTFDRARRYTIWESLQQPATYMVVPTHYRVARDPSGRPELEWLQVFDAGVEGGLPCLLQARCVPDISAAELAELESRLRAAVGGRDVRLLLPTSPSVGVTGAAVHDSTITGQLRAVLDDDAIRLALRVDYQDAVVIVTQLRGGEAVAQLTFDSRDIRLALATTVHLDVDELAGPYPDGPIRVIETRLRNTADTTATVTALWARSTTNEWTRHPLDPPVTVPPDGEVAAPAAISGTIPEARMEAADPAQLVVRNVYLENLHTAVLIRRDVDLEAARITGVGLIFTVSGVNVTRAILPAAAPIIEVTLVQPLVADRPSFDRKVTITATLMKADGISEPTPTGPTVVDLSTGAVITLSSLIGA